MFVLSSGMFCTSVKNLIITSIFVFWVYFSDQPPDQALPQLATVSHSSVWCSHTDSKVKSCKFFNLFYNKFFGFIFILTNASIISGLESYEQLKTLMLTPIDDHTGMHMKLNMVMISDKITKDFMYLRGNYFLLHRFKPDNLMHVIHDDLIPLFQRYREICFGNVTFCSSKFSLILSDSSEKGRYVEWYRALSLHEPLPINDLALKGTICISTLITGVSNTSFFQYGFKKVQGPLKSKLHGSDIVEFKDYFLNYFKVRLQEKSSYFITVISRSINRKILNEDYIFDVMQFHLRQMVSLGRKIVLNKIEMTQNGTEAVLNVVACSNFLIAMHGAETALSLFLPRGSVFIELFPFGIFGENVSPISSLSFQTRTHFKYLSWTNQNESNSMVHPEYLKEFGGIREYSPEDQLRIIQTKFIPPVKCCNNPYYLFRMYQDTLVDDSFAIVAKDAMSIFNDFSESNVFQEWFFPGPVRNLTCVAHSTHLVIRWGIPFNIVYASMLLPGYNVSLLSGEEHLNFITRNSSLVVEQNCAAPNFCQVWVNCFLGVLVSVESYTECSLKI